MAVVNTKATIVSNSDATPKVMNPQILQNAPVREQVATVEVMAADDNNSTYRLARVHTSWRISELTLFNDAIASGTDFDLGLFRTAEDGGAAVDDNAYADQISLASASLTGTQLLFEAGSAKGVEKIEEPIWKDAGYTSDPGYWLDVVLTGFVVGTATGTVSLRTRYVAP
jgi:hypothetical protein